MANKILVNITYPDYQEMIRHKLGVDNSVLPDEIIDSMTGTELAEKLIVKRLTDAKLNYITILAGDDAIYLKMATIFCVCALLAKDFGQGILRSERIADYQYENFQIDMKEREKGFWEKVDENLGQISGYTFPTKKPLEFLEGSEETTEEESGTSSPY